MSSLSFFEQVALFSQAEQIVGPHGAGLANLAFASNCEVVEIFGTKIRPTFYMMAEKLNLDYQLVFGEPDADFEHMRIDPKKVISALNSRSSVD